MRWEPIGLEHQAILEKRLGRLGLEISQTTFAGAYLFRHLSRGCQDVLVEHNLFLRGVTREGRIYLTPTAPPEEWDFPRLKELMKGGVGLFPIPEDWIGILKKEGFQLSYDRGESDYLVPRSQFESYPGRHLQAKRNLVKQFHAQHQVEVEALQEGDARAQELIELWQAQSGKDREETDYLPALEALHQLNTLGLKGRLSLVQGKAVAVVMGEPLNGHTYVVHVGKGDRLYKGVYPFAFQDFAKSLPENYHVLNLEEDLGLKGLRQSKLSYAPSRICHKYWATL